MAACSCKCVWLGLALGYFVTAMRGLSQLLYRWLQRPRTIVACLAVLLATPLTASLAIAQERGAPDMLMQSSFAQPEQLMFGLIAGVLLTAAIYLFFIWLAIRDRSQIALIMILTALAANLGLSTGVVLQALGIETETTALFLREASMLIFLVGACFFTISFLEVSNFSYTIAGFYKIAAVALAGVFVLLAFNTHFIVRLMPMVNLATFALCLLGGLLALGQRVPGAGIHILAFSLLMIGALAVPLEDVGVVSGKIFGVNLFFFTSAAAALVFAVGIAGQFSRRQEEKERQLTVSNERFALAALGSNEGLFDWNVEERTAFFSDRMKKIIGRDLEATPEGVRQWLDLVTIDQRKQTQKMLNDFMEGDAITIGFEYKIRRPDGTERWLYSSGVALRDARSGKVRRLVGSTGDISERKKAEVALKESEERFRNITEAHPVPVAILAISDGKVLYASPGVEDLLGLTLAEILGYRAADYFVNAEDQQQLMTDVVYQQHVDGREVMMRRANGDELPVAISARLIDYQEQAAAVMGFADLTDRKQAEDEIASQRKALEQSEKLAALGSLLAGVAHELNNPLSVVVGQSTLLLETNTDPKTQTRADKIKKAAERCTRIVRNFLALARRKDPERKQVNINQMVESALELIAPQLKTDNVELKLELDPAIPEVSADTDQLTQILTNLVLNAKQALIEQPEPRLVTVRTMADAVGQKVMLKVADNGPGVPPHIRARIFEPFFTTKKEGKGTGIGLSLSLGLAEAHGGAISYEDSAGGGATFVLTLPVSAIDSAVALVGEHTGGTSATPEPEAPQTPTVLQPMRLLLVDDEVDVMQILGDLLAKDGHTNVQVENGERALLALTEQGPFDIIISDLRMPVMDGPTMYRTIRERFAEYKDRIMFVTGDTLSPHVRDFLEEYPVIVIDKPYMLDDIRLAMGRVLRIVEKAAQKASGTPSGVPSGTPAGAAGDAASSGANNTMAESSQGG